MHAKWMWMALLTLGTWAGAASLAQTPAATTRTDGAHGSARAADSPPLVIESKIPLGEVRGRIDHLGVDLGRHRLYVAELGNDSIGVVDLEAGRVLQTLRGLQEPQGIGYEAQTDTLYVAN